MDVAALLQHAQEIGSGLERVGHGILGKRGASFREAGPASATRSPTRGDLAPATSFSRCANRPAADFRRKASEISSLMSPRPSEDDLIARIFAPLAGPAGLGLGDDVALADAAAGRRSRPHHRRAGRGRAFLRRRSARRDRPQGAAGQSLRPRRQGRRAARLSRSRSRCRATGGGLARSLRRRPRRRTRRRIDCPLIGGDTVSDAGAADAVRSPPSARSTSGAWRCAPASAPATGSTSPARSATPRSACACGSGRGPTLAARRPRAFCSTATFCRSRASRWRRRCARIASAGMDISDGFVGDLTKMLGVCGVTAACRSDRLPLSPAARAAIAADPDLFAIAATGGDDYELLVAVAPGSARRLRSGSRRRGRRRSRFDRRGGRGATAAALRRSATAAPVDVRARLVQSLLKAGVRMTDDRPHASHALARRRRRSRAKRARSPTPLSRSLLLHRRLQGAAGLSDRSRRRGRDAASPTRLHAAFPEDGFIGEESRGARRPAAGGAIWVVDPIDGTSNFARGMSHFCVSIACVLDRQGRGRRRSTIRCVDELFAARRGGGARLNGAAIRASEAAALANSLPSRSAGTCARAQRNSRSPSAGSSLAGAAPFAHRLGRARHRLCRRGTARRLCRAAHQRLGLPGGDSAGAAKPAATSATFSPATG